MSVTVPLPEGASPPCRTRTRRLPRRARGGGRLVRVGIALAGLLTGCRSHPPADWAPPGVEEGRVATETAAMTEPQHPQRVDFRWRVREADLRFQGKGVARIQPPYRIRIDLFTPQGETLFQAALVEGSLRIPPWAPRELAPPSALLWAALGVFRPDTDLELLGGRQERDGSVILRYGSEGSHELRFRVLDGRLTRAELYRGGHLEEEVDLTLDEASGAVVESVYRNRAEFLELIFTLEGVEPVDAFPSAIWNPGL